LNVQLKIVLALVFLLGVIIANAEIRFPAPVTQQIRFDSTGDLNSREVTDARLIQGSPGGAYTLSFIVRTSNPRPGNVSIPFPKTSIPSNFITSVQLGGNGTQSYSPVQFFSENASEYVITFAWQPLVLPDVNIVNVQFAPRQFPQLVDYFALAALVLLVSAAGETVLIAKKKAGSLKMSIRSVNLKLGVLGIALGVAIFLAAVSARSPREIVLNDVVVIASVAIVGLSKLIIRPLGGTLTAGTVGVLVASFDRADFGFSLVVWIFFGLAVDGLYSVFKPNEKSGLVHLVVFVSVITSAAVATGFTNFVLVESLKLLPTNPIAEFGLQCPSLVFECHPSGAPLGIVGVAAVAASWEASRLYLDRRKQSPTLQGDADGQEGSEPQGEPVTQSRSL
jgi:hypothetical protein